MLLQSTLLLVDFHIELCFCLCPAGVPTACSDVPAVDIPGNAGALSILLVSNDNGIISVTSVAAMPSQLIPASLVFIMFLLC